MARPKQTARRGRSRSTKSVSNDTKTDEQDPPTIEDSASAAEETTSMTLQSSADNNSKENGEASHVTSAAHCDAAVIPSAMDEAPQSSPDKTLTSRGTTVTTNDDDAATQEEESLTQKFKEHSVSDDKDETVNEMEATTELDADSKANTSLCMKVKGCLKRMSDLKKEDEHDSTAIEFTVDDDEFAEFDGTEENGLQEDSTVTPDDDDDPDDGAVSTVQNAQTEETPVKDNAEVRTDFPVTSSDKQEASVASASTSPQQPVKKTSVTKKIKRKFGLEYIVVSVVSPSEGVVQAPPCMRTSPHECVLCLPGETLTASILAKHVHSADHLKKLLSLHNTGLYGQHKDSEDAEALHQLLMDTIPEPKQQVKLLVVTEAKLEETRNKIIAAVEEKKKSLEKEGEESPKKEGDLRSKLDSLREKKRALEGGAENSLEKKTKMEEESTPRKSVLIVGDERAKQLCDACPALAEMSTLACYPGGQLEQILAGAIMRLNTSYKVIVVVGLLQDFVTGKADRRSQLLMNNPDVDAMIKTIRRFSLRIKNMSPGVNIFFTIPTYVDFVQYNKVLKHLSPADFMRLNDFNCQIMDGFKYVFDSVRHMAKTFFCYNMSMTLCHPTIDMHDYGGKPNRALAPGTLEDGFRQTKRATGIVAEDMTKRLKSLLNRIPAYVGQARGSGFIECWADCDEILIVGDHHTFKFEQSAPFDMVRNVKLVTEKFSPMEKMLKVADSMLTPSVDLLIVVGFYREFAQNVIHGQQTILQPKVPEKRELFAMLDMYKKRWLYKYPRLSVVFTIPQVVDFYTYNLSTNPAIQRNSHYTKTMHNYSHQFSINIMTFYKELRPALTMGTKNIWLYHITNSLYEHHGELLPTLGEFNVEPQFPPDSTFDGFKPNQATARRMRADLVHYVTKLMRKRSVKSYDVLKKEKQK